MEKSAQDAGDDKVLYETRGVLYHELTHAYQLEPQGIGGYVGGTEFWVFIEEWQMQYDTKMVFSQ